MKIIMALFALASLFTMVLGVYKQEWFGIFGFVLFVTSLIINFSLYLTKQDYFEHHNTKSV